MAKNRSTRKTKPTYTINRKTLDMQHADKMSDIDKNRKDISKLRAELDSIASRLQESSCELEESIKLRDKASDIKVHLNTLCNKSTGVEYFADTAGILFRYYDLVEPPKQQQPDEIEKIPGPIIPVIVKPPSVVKPSNPVNANRNIVQQHGSILNYFGGSMKNSSSVATTTLTPMDTSSPNNKYTSKSMSTNNNDCTRAKEDKDSDDQRGTLLEKYMEYTDPNHVKTAIVSEQASVCDFCGFEQRMIMHNDGYMLCNRCHSIEYVIVDHDKPSYKDPPKEISYYAYKRLNHFNEWLNQVQGKETTDIPDEIYDKILFEIKKQKIENIATLSHASIRAILKKLKINKYYEHIPHIINRLNGIPMPHLSPELEEKLRNMFTLIQTPFVKYQPLVRKNFLSYSYVLHKFIQLLGHDEYLANFPLLKSREKLHKQDQTWCKICEDLNWEFIKSL